jgi:hypothetical protein
MVVSMVVVEVCVISTSASVLVVVGRGARVGLASTKLGKSTSSTRRARGSCECRRENEIVKEMKSIEREGVPTGCTTIAVEDGVTGTTTMAVEDAFAAEDEGMNVILDAGMAGGVERVSVMRPSSGLPE